MDLQINIGIYPITFILYFSAADFYFENLIATSTVVILIDSNMLIALTVYKLFTDTF